MLEIVYCRACMDSGTALKSLFETNFESRQLSEIFFLITGVLCLEDENFSKAICAECEKALISAFNFRQRVQETEQSLREASLLATKEGIVEEIDEPKVIQTIEQPEVEVKPTVELHFDLSREAEKLNLCSDCHAEFDSKADLSRHTKDFHGKKLKVANSSCFCNECGRKFAQKSILTKHLKRVHFKSLNRHLCSACGLSFLDQHMLKIHTIKKHGGEKSYSCDFCPKKFEYPYMLADHLLIHANVSFFVCGECGKSFRTKIYLKIHKEGVHPTDPFSVPCPHCKKNYRTRIQLKSHIERVHKVNTERYTCTECHKAFRFLNSLKAHRVEHSGAYFKCEKCPKQYNTERYLKVHVLKSHSTEKRQFGCHLCTSAFFISGELTRHFKSVHKLTINASAMEQFKKN